MGDGFNTPTFFIVSGFSGWLFSPFLEISPDFSDFRFSGGSVFLSFRGVRFRDSGSKKGVEKTSKKGGFRQKGGIVYSNPLLHRKAF